MTPLIIIIVTWMHKLLARIKRAPAVHWLIHDMEVDRDQLIAILIIFFGSVILVSLEQAGLVDMLRRAPMQLSAHTYVSMTIS